MAFGSIFGIEVCEFETFLHGEFETIRASHTEACAHEIERVCGGNRGGARRTAAQESQKRCQLVVVQIERDLLAIEKIRETNINGRGLDEGGGAGRAAGG